MAQCSPGGTISTATTTTCTISSGTLSITSSGSISVSGASNALTVPNSSSNVVSISNAGTISGVGGRAINNTGGTIQNLTNLFIITSVVDAINNSASGTIGNLTNNAGATIRTTSNGNRNVINNISNGTITSLTNHGTITSSANFPVINNGNGATIISINNSAAGLIENTGTTSALSRAINNFGSGSVIQTINNAGNISGGIEAAAIFNNTNSTIATIINTGRISGATGVENLGTITTLNNQQGASSSALTYTAKLPTNYNIIIRSPTEYGQLAVTSPSGSTKFGIFAGSTVNANGRYSNVLQGFSSLDSVTNGTGTYDTYNYSLVASNSLANAWDLCFGDCSGQPTPPAPVGPSTVDTQQSLVNTASQLQNTYTLQNSVLANSFSYDCNVFGANKVCVSAGVRNTAVSAANGLNNTSALLIAAYRIKPTLRIGAYVDQNLSVNNAGSTVNLGNNTPLIGLFGAWSQRLDGTGAEVKVSAAYGQKNTTVSRSAVGSGATASEAGSGSSTLNSQGAQVTAKYGFAVTDKAMVSPYVGVRYTQNNMGGYTEGTSSSVTAPLTYSALNTNATTALAGVGAFYKVIPTVTTFASAGVETDTNTANGTYSATGITGLTPVNFNPYPVKTRSTATLGAYYDIVKNQRIGITGIYRQESYQAISSTTVMVMYTIGL